MNGKALSIKNDSKISFLAKEITKFIGRGSSTTEKLATTLKEIEESSGIKSLKNLEQQHINRIVENLKDKVISGTMSLSNANSYVSSINNIVRYLNNSELHSVKAENCGLSRNISEKDSINKENSREAATAYKEWLGQKYIETKDLRYESLKHAVSIQSVNLRLRESLLVKLISKDLSKDILKINAKGDGAKNSRAREISLTVEQKSSLLEARQFLKDNNLKNLNIGTVQQGRNFANNTLKKFRGETNNYFHFHGERHYVAHQAYKAAWELKGYNVECRAKTGESKQNWQDRIVSTTGLSKTEFIKMDTEIRLNISRELGHERVEISSRYLG